MHQQNNLEHIIKRISFLFVCMYEGNFQMINLAAVVVDGQRDAQPDSVSTQTAPDQVQRVVDPQHGLPPSVSTGCFQLSLPI